jgi:hypothetical protein
MERRCRQMPAAKTYTLTDKVTATLNAETVKKKGDLNGMDWYLVRVFPRQSCVRAGGVFTDLGGKNFNWVGQPRSRKLSKGYVGRTVNANPLELEIWMSYNPSG